ncbi:MAG: L-threonine dehydratase catabolic TdcB [Pseudomonadota bacterium]
MNHPAATLAVAYADVESAATRLQGIANRTPVLSSRDFNRQVKAQVFFKAENFQRIGAFKFRGAYNALAQLSAQQKKAGVVTYSSGNHAQAVALAAKLLGINATIVMPSNAPASKLAATKSYGAEVVLHDPASETRESVANKILQQQGGEMIPPYDYAPVIAGQGTAAKELIEEVGPLDYLLVCCGGGGLLSGCAIAANTLSPFCKTIGVEPEAGDDAARSFKSKTLQSVKNPDTIADGARTASLGALTFPLVLYYAHDIITVSDVDLIQAMKFFFERMKIVVEPTGALATAALLSGKFKAPDAKIGVIISGGNVDVQSYSKYLI